MVTSISKREEKKKRSLFCRYWPMVEPQDNRNAMRNSVWGPWDQCWLLAPQVKDARCEGWSFQLSHDLLVRSENVPWPLQNSLQPNRDLSLAECLWAGKNQMSSRVVTKYDYLTQNVRGCSAGGLFSADPDAWMFAYIDIQGEKNYLYICLYVQMLDKTWSIFSVQLRWVFCDCQNGDKVVHCHVFECTKQLNANIWLVVIWTDASFPPFLSMRRR